MAPAKAKYPFIGQDFDDIVDKLSEKYQQKPERVSGLMMTVAVKLIMQDPRKYAFHQNLTHDDSYMRVERYLGIEKAKYERLREGK